MDDKMLEHAVTDLCFQMRDLTNAVIKIAGEIGTKLSATESMVFAAALNDARTAAALNETAGRARRNRDLVDWGDDT
jgi:hypothetical protein